MRIVFWQNCLSPHQLPYIVHLMDDGRVDEVVVVADETISKERKDMGWSVEDFPGLDRCIIEMHPDERKIKDILTCRMDDSWHLFSGIHGFPYLFHCLKTSMEYPVRRGVITELPNTFAFGRKNGKPLWLHKLRFFVQDRKYATRIDKVFAMGRLATDYFKSVNRNWSVYPFMYCTERQECTCFSVGKGPTKFIFVGSLSYRKAPEVLSCAFVSNKKRFPEFNSLITFVGDGPLRPQIEKEITFEKMNALVEMARFQPQKEIPMWLSKHDILVLPSIYDGWGAVVNEALQAGLFVICSDACGAADLLKDERLGKVFHAGNTEELSQILLWCDKNISWIRKNYEWRRTWAQDNISGRVLARYMVDCLTNDKVENLY